jgi:hypothetical protein
MNFVCSTLVFVFLQALVIVFKFFNEAQLQRECKKYYMTFNFHSLYYFIFYYFHLRGTYFKIVTRNLK